MLPTISVDKNYSVVSIGSITLYFSYKVLIAFSSPFGLVVHINEWGTITGKHLNQVNRDKSIRVDHETFVNNYKQHIMPRVGQYLP